MAKQSEVSAWLPVHLYEPAWATEYAYAFPGINKQSLANAETFEAYGLQWVPIRKYGISENEG